MRGGRQAPAIQSSLLDRLFDDRPHDTAVADLATQVDLRDYRTRVARDLEMLLNTRRSDPHDRAAAFPLAARSLARYGVMDLNSLSLHDPDDQSALREDIRRTIECFEPRLRKVRVALDLPRASERALRFRVAAVLAAHPHQPTVTFDATLQLASSAYQVVDRD